MDVEVSFDDKSATVRYIPGKVTLDQIIKRYQDTPFGVVPSGPVVSIARTPHGVIRGWTERTEPASKGSKSDADSAAPKPIQLFLEFVAQDSAKADSQPNLSLADPPAAGLAVLEEFRNAEKRFVAKLYETVALKTGETTIPVHFEFPRPGGAAKKGDGEKKSANKLQVVLRTARKAAAISDAGATGVALIGGTLDLQLGHLCDQKGCVHHFHQSLSGIRGLGAVNPHPSLKNPRATAYLRAGHPIDVWKLREHLRDQSIEVAGITPRDLSDYRLRIELPRWRLGETVGRLSESSSRRKVHDSESRATVQQCMVCRDKVAAAIKNLNWAADVAVAGGGINFRPKNSSVDLVDLLDTITHTGTAPSAVWLVPSGAPMPKAAPPLNVQSHETPKVVGSEAHPRIEFDLAHTCQVGGNLASLLHERKWASATHLDADEIPQAWASIADRQFANLTPLLVGLRSSGHTPREIRLRQFGDIRIQLEFAHICGDVEYSKPPKPKKKKDQKKNQKKDAKPKKPFVPQPISMAKTSNGRKAIQAAIESVSWVKIGLFYDYHTKFEFRGGPRKITFALQAKGDDVVRLDELIDALRAAGFPPKSVVVSRRFPGIPFGKPLPGDLQLTGRDGKKQTLASFKKPKRPLIVAFLSLKTKARSKYSKYKADPKLFGRLGETIEAYKDRVDIVAVSANKDDPFPEVAEFWDKTKLAALLLHDADGLAGAVFNVQITPPPHIFIFDADGLLRYAGDAHSHWEKPGEKHDDYLAKALDGVLSEKYLDNGAVFYNKSVCNCSHPKCKCPKCGCGSSCRCAINHCSVGF